jgi:hypothetical protein
VPVVLRPDGGGIAFVDGHRIVVWTELVSYRAGGPKTKDLSPQEVRSAPAVAVTRNNQGVVGEPNCRGAQ